MTGDVIDWLVKVSQGAVLVVLSAGVRGVFSIRDEMRKMNGRMFSLESWTREHEKRDDERFRDVDKDVERIDRSVGRPRG